jgi:hypothetical protein
MHTTEDPEAGPPDTQTGLTSDTVSTRINDWLTTHDRTQAWLARRMDVGVVWLSRRMTGRTPWLVDDLRHIATALNVTTASLVSDGTDHHTVASVPQQHGRTLGTGR